MCRCKSMEIHIELQRFGLIPSDEARNSGLLGWCCFWRSLFGFAGLTLHVDRHHFIAVRILEVLSDAFLGAQSCRNIQLRKILLLFCPWSRGRLCRRNFHFEGVQILPEKSMTAAALEHGVNQLISPILPQILKQLKFKVMSK